MVLWQRLNWLLAIIRLSMLVSSSLSAIQGML